MEKSGEPMLSADAPPMELAAMFGMLNLAWARIDILSSACLYTMVNMNPNEFVIVLGNLDVLAKLQKIKKLFLQRKRQKKSEKIDSVIKSLNNIKDERNAITHGLYNGLSAKNEIFFTVFSESVTQSKDNIGLRLFVTSPQEIKVHVEVIFSCVKELWDLFDNAKLRELLEMPAFAPTLAK